MSFASGQQQNLRFIHSASCGLKRLVKKWEDFVEILCYYGNAEIFRTGIIYHFFFNNVYVEKTLVFSTFLC